MAQFELTQEQFQRIARAISDPNRFELLRLIYRTPESTCGDVIANVPITAGTASHHLRELELAELIYVTKEGRFRKLTPRRETWDAYMAQLRTL
jgi:ArsR family transcriptional regulator